ncbi:16S rRNA (cytosine(1402)-N(4))-methyltransferase RsmH [candidate division KSB1 bacterium]|nr:16S rRNA (cytosine(1402)-N(4))-methyltransferase RsmH [candidate division KSB1 bacterium]
MVEEVSNLLITRGDGFYLDGTVGGGGHALAILVKLKPEGRLIGLDWDPEAIFYARERLKNFNNVILIRANYTALEEILAATGFRELDGILLDLGVSSHHLDTPGRGFSYRFAGKLDMRMDPDSALTAWGVINSYSESKLADIFFYYGGRKRARFIARNIVNRRRTQPITTTAELAAIVRRGLGGGPVTKRLSRLFQAIRIEVNHELENLEAFLPMAVKALRLGGRIAVISYHSLEDRLVKTFFRDQAKDCRCPPNFPECRCGAEPILKVLTPKPVRPSTEEVSANPRCRSGALRVAERVKT